MNLKNKTIACVFAHPDDEAFGPSGTISKWSKNNNIYLLCATKGESGENYIKSQSSLAKIREKELLKSAQILGIKKVFFLGFKDSTLCNKNYHQLAASIQKKFKKIKPEIVITFEPRGISGHLDHISVSLTTSFVAQKCSYVKTVLYYCLDNTQVKQTPKDYFIFFPPVYKKENIDLRIDISSTIQKKLKAIKTHRSQLKDINQIISRFKKRGKEECFIIGKKKK